MKNKESFSFSLLTNEFKVQNSLPFVNKCVKKPQKGDKNIQKMRKTMKSCVDLSTVFFHIVSRLKSLANHPKPLIEILNPPILRLVPSLVPQTKENRENFKIKIENFIDQHR